jgi:alpha-ribazole phosphatase
MMRVLLVAHAETSWNVAGRFQGQTDVPLSEHGRQQAARLQARLASETIDVAYASDLCRAWETATIVMQSHSLPLHAEPRLRELRFGAWEGMTREEIRAADPDAFSAWEANPDRLAPPGGESLADVEARVQSFLDSLRQREPVERETILATAHRGSLRVLLCLALGIPTAAMWRFRLNVASLSDLELHSRTAVLISLNDTHHLQEAAHAG